MKGIQLLIFQRVDEHLEEKGKKVPNVEKLLAIKDVGMSTVIGFGVEVGDIGHFTNPKQKIAGLGTVMKSSRKRKASQESVRGADENCEEPCINQHVY